MLQVIEFLAQGRCFLDRPARENNILGTHGFRHRATTCIVPPGASSQGARGMALCMTFPSGLSGYISIGFRSLKISPAQMSNSRS